MLLVRGDYVWTGSELLQEAAVLCGGGKIEAVGSWQQLRTLHPEVRIVGGTGRIVLPGLINAHHHGNGITSFARGVFDDNLEPWLAGLGAAPSVDPYLDTLLAALDTVQGGYTTLVLFQSTADPGAARQEAVARIEACRAVGVRVAFGLDVTQRNFYVYGPDPQGLSARSGLSADAYVALLDELRRHYADDAGVQIFAAPSGPEWVTDETWSAVGEWSLRHGVPLHTHCLESPLQAEYARRQYKDGLVAHLDRLGAIHEHTSLVHGVYLDAADFELLAAKGAALITNPGSNLRLRCGVSPVLLALDKGVNVALGTDGCSLGDRDDAFAEMRLLFYLQRGSGLNTPALTWQQAFDMSTRAAARVTPWGGDQLGTITVGEQADLSVYHLDEAAGPWRHPDLHPVHVLLHRATRQHVDAIVVDGQLIWDAEDGARLVDEAEAWARAGAIMGKVDLPGEAESGAAADSPGAERSLPDIVRAYYADWLRQGE